MPKLGQGGTGSLPTEFPWCGHLIDSVTLDFHADYTRYFGTGTCKCVSGCSTLLILGPSRQKTSRRQ